MLLRIHTFYLDYVLHNHCFSIPVYALIKILWVGMTLIRTLLILWYNQNFWNISIPYLALSIVLALLLPLHCATHFHFSLSIVLYTLLLRPNDYLNSLQSLANVFLPFHYLCPGIFSFWAYSIMLHSAKLFIPRGSSFEIWLHVFWCNCLVSVSHAHVTEKMESETGMDKQMKEGRAKYRGNYMEMQECS